MAPGNAAVAESSATAAGTNSHCVVYLNPTDNSLTFNANAAGVDPVTTSCMASIGGIVQ